CADAQVAPPRVRLTGLTLNGEERVGSVEAGRREHIKPPPEDCLHLFGGAANRGSRGDHLGSNFLPVDLPSAKPVDCGLVEADHRAEWPGNQVQLVLNDQVWRTQRAGRNGPRLREWPTLRVTVSVLEIGRAKAVPLAPTGYLPKERLHGP